MCVIDVCLCVYVRVYVRVCVCVCVFYVAFNNLSATCIARRWLPIALDAIALGF